MDEAEALVDFLVEDLELLLVHASSDPVHTDEVQIMTSLCRDLKFISSFLKNVPEYLLKQQKNEDQELGNLAKVVKSLKKEILGIFKDAKICAAIESPEVGVDACNSVDLSERSKGIAPFGQVGVAIGVDEGERALLERLIGGGEKQLEVISVSGITWNPGILVKRLFENPIILDHFQICEKGSFWFTETSCYSKLTDPYNRKAKGFFRKFCETARGNRYLVLMEKSEYKEVRTVLPDECNGSKVLMVEGFSDSEVKGDYIFQRIRKMTSEIFECLDLFSLAEKVDSTKKNILRVYNNGFSAMDPEGKGVFCENLQGKSGSLIVGEDLIVGIQDEAVALLDRLTGGKKQLEIISVAGMGGIGKTTLAKKVYNDPSIVYHFHIRGWACISQTYQKRNVLHNILCYLVEDKVSLTEMSDHAMGGMLYKFLKSKKYLIVIDDIWDVRDWNDLKIYFPDNQNGSRILMTSRIRDVARNLGGNVNPHCLRFLRKDESWELFKHKVFASRSCPQELMEIGTEIVAKCKGLPLAIVVVAGIVAKRKYTYHWWQHVAENIGSCLDSDAEQFMDILMMSYDSLPHPLKSCFLYLGAFPEDCEISVRRLIQSWIAEGFIQCTEGKSLEHVAEDCLMNLIDRSLVTVSKKRPDGGVKTCCVHDMLRNLCIRKANENKFLLPNLRYESYSSSSPFRPLFINYFYSHNAFSLTCYKSNCEDLHSFYVHYVPARWVFSEQLLSFKYSPLRVLDLRCIIIDFFPTQILLLVRLKYLALWIEKMKSLPSAMCNLWNLETLILNIEKVRQVTIPHHVWKMVKLRHLHISPEIQFQWPCSSSAGAGAGASFVPFETLRNHIPELPASDTFSVSSQESILQTNSPKSHPSFAAYSSSPDQEFDHPYSGTATNSFFPHGNLLEQELEHPCSEAATTSSISDSLEPNSPELENGISCPSSSGPNVDHLYPSRKSSRLSELGKLHIIESAQPSFSVTSNSCQEELEEGLEEPSAYSSSAILDNLQTISRLCPSGCIDDVLERIPNVRKLGFHFTLSDAGDPLLFPDLADLHLLESLKFEYQTFGMVPMSLPHPDKFPPSLKKLTLVGSHVSWEEMTLIGMLPNLEVLKVKENFFSGPKWETCEGGFHNLKFLKFSHLDLREWITSADDFPSLEQLVLNGCLDLAEIPSAVGDICTLQVIEVYRASDSLIDSAMQIQETQRSWGNNEFKVFIHHDFQENISV